MQNPPLFQIATLADSRRNGGHRWAVRAGGRSGRAQTALSLLHFVNRFSMTAQFMGQFHSSDFRRCECKANLQNSASPGSFRKRSKQWPVPGRETEKLAYVRAGNFGRFLRLWAIIDVSESGVVRLNGPKTSPESGPFAGLSHASFVYTSTVVMY